jgi:hypothetical protein
MRTLIIIILTFCFSWSNAQEYLIDLRVKKIQYQEDSIAFEVASELEILTNKTTEIINLGKVGKQEIGVQFEILTSELGEVSSHILGKAYYHRESENSDWLKIAGSAYSRTGVNNIDSRVEAEQKRVERIKNAPNERLRKMFSQMNSDSSGDPGNSGYFKIDYLLFVYLNE